MRRPLIATTAVAAVTGGLTLGLGLAGGGSPALAAPLPAFGDCDELLGWYVDRALPTVGPFGLGSDRPVGGVLSAAEDSVGSGSADAASSGSGAAAPRSVTPESETNVGSSGTGTNVQEAAVDEPDLAKTDGRLLVRVVGDELRVALVGDAGPGEVEDVGVLGLADDLVASELLLHGDRVLVIGGSPGFGGRPIPLAEPGPPSLVEPGISESEPLPLPTVEPDPLPLPAPSPPPELMPRRVLPPAPYAAERSRVVEVDLTDPAAPRVLSDRTYGGELLSARQYDDQGSPVVRLVLRTTTPTLDFVEPNRDRTEQEATEENRRIVRESELTDWLPTVRGTEGSSSSAEQLVDCRDVRHPVGTSGAGPDWSTLSIVTLPFSDPADTTATAVTTPADTVYSSADRLYLALPGHDGSTGVHAFALEGRTTRYVASGSVDGHVRDRWSMDEEDGVLRLAVGFGPGWSSSDNGIVTLREDGGRLERVGSVRGLGPDEEIKSVRWLGDLAVVVTFRQTDPLYTVDLSDPRRPRTLGELKIPGFSAYLHPIGDDRLLGVGQDATDQGQTLGGQVSVFDLADLTDPRRLSVLGLDTVSLLSDTDPRAFTWLPEEQVGLVGTVDSLTGRTGFLELTVGDDGSVDAGRRWSLPGYGWDGWGSGGSAPRALPLGDGRVALVGGAVLVVGIG